MPPGIPQRGGDEMRDQYDFGHFFSRATCIEEGPYPYQERFALKEKLPQVVDIPTGCGKTAGVVLAWLWRRRFADRETRDKTPRRLVYCLPMRVLVEQTRDNCVNWLHRLGLLNGAAYVQPKEGIEFVTDYEPNWEHPDKIAVTVLMGGEDRDDWDMYPERDAIIIGTQDMLLSRALNRGYGMSRYRWPVHFGLLNNDCLWVMDEVQLMGVGVETSAQMDAFRNMLGTYGPSGTIWMSATVDENRLKTVDMKKDVLYRIGLGEDDDTTSQITKRKGAKKEIVNSMIKLDKETSKGSYVQDIERFIIDRHKEGELTLVIVNTVSRAQAIYGELIKNGRNPSNTALIHSRFREPDRAGSLKKLHENGDRIVVSTQVVEAGVDISANVLITEIAPWSSMVQRFGRCNRYGEFDDSTIHWMDIEEGHSSPYDDSEIQISRAVLEKLDNASPDGLAEVEYTPPEIVRPVVRRKDVLELFDTTPDLTGNDIDVSRYVRDGDDKDVQVFWREISEREPDKDMPAPDRNELCSVPVGEINDFSKKNANAIWYWDHLDETWVRKSDRIVPGSILLIDSMSGGYRSDLGWIGKKWKKRDGPVEVLFVSNPTKKNESTGSEENSVRQRWISITRHCNDVKNYLDKFSKNVGLPNEEFECISQAALWHDVGKSHPAFQNAILENSSKMHTTNELWAKTDRPNGWMQYFTIDRNEEGNEVRKVRKYFRHELASAMAWLEMNGSSGPGSDLTGYLIAAHHGKVRQSIRSIPDETEPEQLDRLFARGVWDGDRLPPVPGITEKEVRLDLSPMVLGEGSWLERSLALLDKYGPYRLSFLESMLRASDWYVSRSYAQGVQA